MEEAKAKVESVVQDILETGQQFDGVPDLSRVYEAKSNLSTMVSKKIRAYAVLIGSKIQQEDSMLQETAVSKLGDARTELKVTIRDALDEVGFKENKRLRKASSIFRHHMDSHMEEAEEVMEKIDHFWTGKLTPALQDNGWQR